MTSQPVFSQEYPSPFSQLEKPMTLGQSLIDLSSNTLHSASTETFLTMHAKDTWNPAPSPPHLLSRARASPPANLAQVAAAGSRASLLLLLF